MMGSPAGGRKPTAKEEKWCRLFVRYGNKTQAYFEAYDVKPEDRDKQWVKTECCRLSQKPVVAFRLAELMAEVDERFKVSVDKIARGFAQIAWFNPRDIMDDEGNVLPVKEWPLWALEAVQSIEVFEEFNKDGTYKGRTKKVRVDSKNGALSALAKWKKMLVDSTTPISGDLSTRSDEELEAERRANEEVLAVVERAQSKARKVKS